MKPATREALLSAGLDPEEVGKLVEAALSEDLGGGVDVTSAATVPAGQRGTAAVVARGAGVLAGSVVAALAFETCDPATSVTLLLPDGAALRPGTPVLEASGEVRALLTAERTALNLLCHLSGVATLTRAWVDAVAPTGARIRDTRKTMPLLRSLEKYAVRCGGGLNHRMGLWDAALVKDNHVVAAGGVAAAFRAVRAAYPGLPVEVECDSVDQVVEAVAAGADLVLLDNMGVADLRRAAAICRERGVLTEASGGLTLPTAAAVAGTGVDYLSVGALTHSAPVLDLGVDLRSD